MLPTVNCNEIRRADERACHSIAWLDVQLNAVVGDMWDKDLSMALLSSTLMFCLWVACTLRLCIGFSLRAGGRTVSRNFERIRYCSVEHSILRMARVICTSFMSRRLTVTQSMRCLCLDLGCIQKVMCMSWSRKKVFWWHVPIQSRELAAEDRYYSCCQLHDDQWHHAICREFCQPRHWNRPAIWFVRFAKSFGGWNTTCHKSDLSHHQMNLMLENGHSQR